MVFSFRAFNLEILSPPSPPSPPCLLPPSLSLSLSLSFHPSGVATPSKFQSEEKCDLCVSTLITIPTPADLDF